MIHTDLREIADELDGVADALNTVMLDSTIKRVRQLADEYTPVCEHKWRDYGYGVVCRDCGADYADNDAGTSA